MSTTAKNSSKSVDSAARQPVDILEGFVLDLSWSLLRTSRYIQLTGFFAALGAIVGFVLAVSVTSQSGALVGKPSIEEHAEYLPALTIILIGFSLLCLFVRDLLIRRGAIRYDVLLEEYENTSKKDQINLGDMGKAKVKIAIRSYDRLSGMPLLPGVVGPFVYFSLNLMSLMIMLLGDVNLVSQLRLLFGL